jgi:hypothetical protein
MGVFLWALVLLLRVIGLGLVGALKGESVWGGGEVVVGVQVSLPSRFFRGKVLGSHLVEVEQRVDV